MAQRIRSIFHIVSLAFVLALAFPTLALAGVFVGNPTGFVPSYVGPNPAETFLALDPVSGCGTEASFSPSWGDTFHIPTGCTVEVKLVMANDTELELGTITVTQQRVFTSTFLVQGQTLVVEPQPGVRVSVLMLM